MEDHVQTHPDDGSPIAGTEVVPEFRYWVGDCKFQLRSTAATTTTSLLTPNGSPSWFANPNRQSLLINLVMPRLAMDLLTGGGIITILIILAAGIMIRSCLSDLSLVYKVTLAPNF